MEKTRSLASIFKDLKDESRYRECIKFRVVKIILASSIIRVFTAGSKPLIRECLNKMEVDIILELQNQGEYDLWLKHRLNKIYNSLAKDPKNVRKLTSEGLKWGHCAKIFNLFIGHLLYYSPYFKERKGIKTVQHFLHMPLDKKVFIALRSCSVSHVPKSIKSIDKKSYQRIQGILREEGINHKIPPLYFDEYAWAYTN